MNLDAVSLAKLFYSRMASKFYSGWFWSWFVCLQHSLSKKTRTVDLMTWSWLLHLSYVWLSPHSAIQLASLPLTPPVNTDWIEVERFGNRCFIGDATYVPHNAVLRLPHSGRSGKLCDHLAKHNHLVESVAARALHRRHISSFTVSNLWLTFGTLWICRSSSTFCLIV